MLKFLNILTELELEVVAVFPAPANLVAASGQFSNGLLQASTDHGALSYNRNSRSVAATKTEIHLSASSELSELDRPFWSHALFRLSHPICFSSPTMPDSVRFASAKAFCAHFEIAECSALNQDIASCGSWARNIHEWMPSGEWSSMHRFSVYKKIFIKNINNIK